MLHVAWAHAVAALAVQSCPVLDSNGHFYLIAAWKVNVASKVLYMYMLLAFLHANIASSTSTHRSGINSDLQCSLYMMPKWWISSYNAHIRMCMVYINYVNRYTHMYSLFLQM